MMLKDKNIVITGSSRGIGRAIVIEAAKNGARVGINFRNSEAEAQDVAVLIRNSGYLDPVLLPFDATKTSDIESGVQRFLESTGRIDGWVNSAAVNISGLLPVLSDHEIQAQLDSALLGPILCCRTVLPALLREGKGSIVNIGSIVAERVFRGQSVYAAAKGGLASFSRALAFEYARKRIRVNCVQPGPVATEMMETTRKLAEEEIVKQLPTGEYIPAEHVASLVVYLLSDASASMTGACLNLDGGFSL